MIVRLFLLLLFSSPAFARDVAVRKMRVLGEDAQIFLQEVEPRLEEAAAEARRADWIQATYITLDTDAMAAKTRERADEIAADYARRSRRFDVARLTPALARKITLLRRYPTLFPPLDPKQAAALSQVISAMSGEYGKGRFCPKKGACQGVEDVTRTMAVSRDPSELLAAWKGWHSIAPPLKAQFASYVKLANAGARDAGFADAGALWRSTYDLPPEEMALEVDRLWEQVRPLYVALHAYVRLKLRETYGSSVPAQGPIPAHLLGNIWAQDWSNVFPLVAPNDLDPGYDLSEILKRRNVGPADMVRYGERFFTSLGFSPLPPSFWERSMLQKPPGRDVICHATAYDIDGADDVRIKACFEQTSEMFETAHHELGHVFYSRAYRNQPFLFKSGASAAFHEAIGDTISLSITPEYLKKIGLLADLPPPSKDIGLLLRLALHKVAFLPFGLMVDEWRWKVFSGAIRPENYNRAWWELRLKYEGIAPPGSRSEADFDPGAKYHVAANIPYMGYFMADLLQFQFHRALARAAGCQGPLLHCSIYQSEAAGAKLRKMLALGASVPWPEALHEMTGEDRIDPSALREYFAPLELWLNEQLRGQPQGW